MFCVIQEVQVMKQNRNGYPKEIESYRCNVTTNGKSYSYWCHLYSDECFERPVKKAYKISVHHSFRKNGKPKKKQFVICTVNYYDLATENFTLMDWGERKIELTAEALGVSPDDIYDLICKKIRPLQDEIIKEFHQTEEYQVHQKHEQIINTYKKRKAEFVKKFDLDDSSIYDRCYDVYGTLHEPDLLKKIEEDYRQKKEYEENFSSYWEDFFSNYNSTGHGSYSKMKSSNYTEDEKSLLKKFYRELTKMYHPDANVGKDTTKHMLLLNKLKDQWEI